MSAWRLHRRGDAVAADADAIGLERVALLGRTENNDLRARLELGLFTGDESHDRRIRRHHDFLLAVLVLDVDDLAVDAGNALRDGSVGHRGIRTQIPGTESFSRATHGLREDVDGERLLAAVGLRHT